MSNPETADGESADGAARALPAEAGGAGPSKPSALAALDTWFNEYVKGSRLAADTDAYKKVAAAFQQLAGLLPSN